MTVPIGAGRNVTSPTVTWKCEVCTRADTVDRYEGMPDGWSKVRTYVKDAHHAALLCPSCAERHVAALISLSMPWALGKPVAAPKKETPMPKRPWWRENAWAVVLGSASTIALVLLETLG